MPHPVGSGNRRNTIWGMVESGGVRKKELVEHLLSRRRMRQAQSASTARQSRLTLFVKVQEKDTISVVTALSTQIRQLTAALRWLLSGIEE